MQAYVPTYLVILVSWVSFSLGSRAIPARTMLGVNALLAIIFQFGNIMRNLPRVSVCLFPIDNNISIMCFSTSKQLMSGC